MSKKTRIMKRFGWMVGAALAAGMSFAHLDAQAHVAAGAQSTWCSPHGQGGSNGGSYFWNCSQVGTTVRYQRQFGCEAGTACANNLCGAGKAACGDSRSSGGSSHGAKGGHTPVISNLACSGCILP